MSNASTSYPLSPVAIGVIMIVYRVVMICYAYDFLLLDILCHNHACASFHILCHLNFGYILVVIMVVINHQKGGDCKLHGH